MILLLVSCADQSGLTAPKVFAFDTVFTQTLYGDGESDIFGTVAVMLDSDEKIYSRTDPESELYKLNHAGDAERLRISEKLTFALNTAERISALTGGAFDPHLGAVSDLWDFEKAVVPDGSAIGSALAARTVTDLGGIAKGIETGEILKAYKKAGFFGGVVSCSSSVGVFGQKTDGSIFKVALRDPGGDGGLAVLTLTDAIISTSGDYERYFIGSDGVRYHHIIDPKTGYPAQNGLHSVTVVARFTDSDDLSYVGALTDAMSTAAFIMGANEKTYALLKELGLDAVFISDEEVTVTGGLRDVISFDKELNINYID